MCTTFTFSDMARMPQTSWSIIANERHGGQDAGASTTLFQRILVRDGRLTRRLAEL